MNFWKYLMGNLRYIAKNIWQVSWFFEIVNISAYVFIFILQFQTYSQFKPTLNICFFKEINTDMFLQQWHKFFVSLLLKTVWRLL